MLSMVTVSAAKEKSKPSPFAMGYATMRFEQLTRLTQRRVRSYGLCAANQFQNFACSRRNIGTGTKNRFHPGIF